MDKGKADHRFQARPLAAIAKRVFTKSRQRLAGVCFLVALHSLRGYPHTSPRNFPYTTDLPPRRASCPGEEERDFFLRIAARQAGKVGEVFLVHAENIVRTGIVRRRDETARREEKGMPFFVSIRLAGGYISFPISSVVAATESTVIAFSHPALRMSAFMINYAMGERQMGLRFFYLILGRKSRRPFFQISCSVCRCVSGGYFVVKVRGK